MPNLKLEADNPLFPLALCVLLYATIHMTNLDPWVTSYFYDPWIGGFPARDSWLYKTIFHDWARWLTFCVGAFVISGFIVTLAQFRDHWSLRAFAFTLISMIITTTAVSIIKHESTTHCPYDLSIYGGKFLEVSSILVGAGDPTDSGRCWPSGHASAGFSLLALFFVARWRNSEWTRPALYLSVFLGLLFTYTQTVRGAHFVSHGLWTGLFVWLGNALLARLMLSDRREVLASDAATMPTVGQNVAFDVIQARVDMQQTQHRVE